MLPGFLVTIEGPDGSGKSTLLDALAAALRAEGREPVVTREPGGSPGAEEIRRLLVEGEPGRWSAETEILLFTAARRDHVERVIEPALEAGRIVLSDRFVDSTRAYQAADDPARLRLVDELHARLIGREPDLTFLLDVDPVAALARTAGRDGPESRFERHGLAFQRRLRQAYLRLAAGAPERVLVLDAGRPAEAVAADAMEALVRRLAA